MNAKHCPDCPARMIKVGYSIKWWWCPGCGATAPLRGTPTKKPNVTLRLSDRHLAWLRAQGGIQPTIKKLIDQAMEKTP